ADVHGQAPGEACRGLATQRQADVLHCCPKQLGQSSAPTGTVGEALREHAAWTLRCGHCGARQTKQWTRTRKSSVVPPQGKSRSVRSSVRWTVLESYPQSGHATVWRVAETWSVRPVASGTRASTCRPQPLGTNAGR